MGVRAMWKGVVRIGEEGVPVKLYAAVQDRKVHFRLLNRRTLTPVKQRMVSPRTNREVPPERIQKGYPTADGRFVMLEEEELQSLEPEPSRDIVVTRFVDPDLVEPAWYDRPYYLGPDEDEEAYAALARAIEQEGRMGVARWIMRKKEYQGALRATDSRLMLVTLRHAGEVVPAAALPAPGGRAPEPQELRMAEQLVNALAGHFDPSEWKDEYRERVAELVQAKARGETIEVPEFRREPAEDDRLSDALEESLASLRKAA